MNINHIVQNLFQENLFSNKALELRDGQLVYGKLTKLFPQQMAEVQIGSQKMFANLTIPLMVDQSYWFQVSVTDDKPVLKVLTQVQEVSAEKGNIKGLLQQLQLPDVKENRLLMSYLLSNNLPITKESIMSIMEWLPSSLGKQELSIIGLMLERELPLTKEVFNSLSSLQTGKGFSALIEELKQQLSAHEIKEPNLNNLLSSLREGGNIGEENNVDILKAIFQKIGYSFEAGLLKRAPMGEEQASNQEMLKPILLELMGKDVPVAVKETAGQLIDKVTGYQLMSQQTGPIMQVIAEIPLRFFNQQVDVTVQYNGRKTTDGKVDSSYCRILFYLELAHLKDTVIDITIQNRIMNMSILNDRASEIMPMIKQADEPLKDKLRELEYQLMSVHARPLTKEDKPLWSSQQPIQVKAYKGVDIKI
ncbi:hypothetical protein [Niallia sp.]|uniref:hypothetical protein n=1 Tax=Niallia sp. TaxID=2837523 RepID=UPI00289A38BD|nr:hypothetical protein [Niallia sp.]